MSERKLKYICEVCGRTEIMTQEEAYLSGWDYPPMIGMYGVLSPRTCPNCPITETVWYQVTCKKQAPAELTDRQREVIERILHEPESLK